MSDGSLRMTRDAYIPAIVSGPYCSGWSMAGIQVTLEKSTYTLGTSETASTSIPANVAAIMAY